MALLCALAISGCKKEEAPALTPAEQRAATMKDPEYNAKLQKRVEGRRANMKKLSAAKAALEAARAEEAPDPVRIATLEAEYQKLQEDVAAYEKESRKFVANQVKKDLQVGQNVQQKGR